MLNILSKLMISCCCLSGLARADDWPQFLGLTRDGISRETGLISKFSSEGPRVLWRTPLGVGMSGIAVSRSIAETPLAVTMDQDESQQYVVALNAASGNVHWKSAIAPAYENAMGNGPRATPAIDQGHVYAFSGEGVLGCFRLSDGQRLWIVETVKTLGGQPAEYGMACSPLLTNDHVLVTVGLPTATVAAYDRKSGELAWTSGTGSPAGYSSPALLQVGPQIQLVVFHGSGAVGMNPQSGKEIWSYPFVTDYSCNIATPFSVDGHVFLSSGENHGSVLLKIPVASGSEVQEVWSSFGNRSVFRNEWQTSKLIDGYLYGFDNVGSAGPVTNLSCLNAKTGTQVWQKRRFGKGNLIAADGKLWCTTMDGELVIVKATPEKFEELDRATLLGQTRQAPALSEGRLFMRDGTEMICIDLRP